VRRDRIEKILLGPICDNLLAPERVALMAKKMQDCDANDFMEVPAQTRDTITWRTGIYQWTGVIPPHGRCKEQR
jgi:hypothetical protein